MSEQLHVLEAYDFLYGFLLRKIFFSFEETDRWTPSEDDEDAFYPFFTDECTEPYYWDIFINNLRLFLRPLDIVSLTITGPPKDDWDKTLHLRSRGIYDMGGCPLGETGRVGRSRALETPDILMSGLMGIARRDAIEPDAYLAQAYMTVSTLEDGLKRILRQRAQEVHVSSDLLGAACDKYRKSWPKKARGKLFTVFDSEEDFIEAIKSCEEGLRSLAI